MGHKKKVKKALKHFDFGRVKTLMEDNKWRWAHKDGNYKVPSISFIKENAEYHLNNLKKNLFSGSGGFTAFKYEDKYLLFFGVDNTDTQFD